MLKFKNNSFGIAINYNFQQNSANRFCTGVICYTENLKHKLYCIKGIENNKT